MSKPPPPDAFGPEDFAAAAGVSRETLARLKAYVGLLREWSARHNLVSGASLQEVWHRHVWDSAQLVPLIPRDAATVADLGSGAGFPGLVLAVMLRDRLRVTLFESIRKKAEFLGTAAKCMQVPVEVRNQRIEAAPREAFDVVAARACAPLPKLFEYAQNLSGPATVCLFLKGQNLGLELTEARKSWRIDARQHPSLTHPKGVVLEIRDFGRRQA